MTMGTKTTSCYGLSSVLNFFFSSVWTQGGNKTAYYLVVVTTNTGLVATVYILEALPAETTSTYITKRGESKE